MKTFGILYSLITTFSVLWLPYQCMKYPEKMLSWKNGTNKFKKISFYLLAFAAWLGCFFVLSKGFESLMTFMPDNMGTVTEEGFFSSYRNGFASFIGFIGAFAGLSIVDNEMKKYQNERQLNAAFDTAKKEVLRLTVENDELKRRI